MSGEKLKVTDLPRGGTIVSTSIGPVQYGIPPETIKDSMALGLPVPMYYIVPSEPFTKTLGSNMGVNVAEFEFPAYCNFFFKRQCVNLIVASQEVEDRIRRVFQETLFGPQTIDVKQDYPHNASTSTHPNLEAELGYFRKFGNTLITLEMLLKFTHFNDENIATLVSGENKVTIRKTDNAFIISDNNQESVTIQDEVRLPPPMSIQHAREVFYPPAFGVTVLGNSHGFDPKGKTTGYVLWINHRGIMVDPPPFSSSILLANSIPPIMIDGVIVTHCHADHDAGTFQKILQEGRVSLITTQTIYHSFLRKYSALSGFTEDFLKRVLNYRMVRINDPTSIRGASFRFFYTLHSIPCVGFEVTYGSKRIVFSGDHLNDVERIKSLREDGILSDKRCNELLAFPWDCDVILHEAGVPPIHTPMKTLMNLEESIRKKVFVVHTAAKDIPQDSGLRAAPEGVQNTIIVPTERPESASTLEVLDLVRKIDIFVDLTLTDAYELIQMAKRVTYNKTSVVLDYGAVADTFYIVIAGEAQAMFPSEENMHQHSRKRLSTVPRSKKYVPGDYFDLQYLLTPNSIAGCTILASSTLSLLEFNASDMSWFLRGTTVFERMEKLIETRHNFAWDTIAENSLFVKLTEMQRTQLELAITKWNVPENLVVWSADEACDIAVFVAEGEFVMTTMSKVVTVNEEPRVPPRKRKGSVNRVVPIDSVASSSETSECQHTNLRRGAFIGNVDALTCNEDRAFGCELVAKTPGVLFSISKHDLKYFLFENPGLLMALSGKMLLVGIQLEPPPRNSHSSVDCMESTLVPIEKGHVGLPEEHPRLRRPKKHSNDPPPVTTYYRWSLDQVEEKLRAKIQERTEMRGNFTYQQAYRLLENKRGKGIDLASFKDTMTNKLGLSLLDKEFEYLFNKYDEDGDGRIDIYEFINNVLPRDYDDQRYTTWVERSHDRIQAHRLQVAKDDRNNYLAGRFLSENNSEQSHPIAWNVEDLRYQIYKKLIQKTPKCMDQYRRAFQVLQRGTNEALTLVDMRQNIKDTLGITMNEEQMHTFFRPFQHGGIVDVRAFLQYIMKADEARGSEVPNGLFTEPDKEYKPPMSGRRHIDPKKNHEITPSFQVSSKRVQGYNKVKGLPPKPFPRRHHHRLSNDTPKFLKATRTTVKFTRLKPTEARPIATPPQSLANLHGPEISKHAWLPSDHLKSAPGIKTVDFITPSQVIHRNDIPRCENDHKASNRPLSPFSPVKRPESPKVMSFQRLPTPKPAPESTRVEPPSTAVSIPHVDASEKDDTIDENLAESMDAVNISDVKEEKPSTPLIRPTTAERPITPVVDAFEPLPPPRISQIHPRQQTTTAYKSMKPNFRITESTFCCR